MSISSPPLSNCLWLLLLFEVMAILHLLFLHFMFLKIYASASDHCPVSTCGNSSIEVRFPFQLQGSKSQTCAYPGFSITCTNHNITALQLPYSGEFFVRSISYASQQLLIYDPDKCLAKRLLDLDLSNSPFTATYFQHYNFLSCPYQIAASRFTTIDCLSNSTTSVVATPSMRLVNSLSSTCTVFRNLSVPVTRPVLHDEDFTDDFDYDILINWNIPECQNCEAEGETCGFKSNEDRQVGCILKSQSGKAATARGIVVVRIICLSLLVPVIIVSFGVALVATLLRRTAIAQRFTANTVSPQPADVAQLGLDTATIESYEKFVLGESLRVPEPNHATCPICLSEYCSKETVRCIPECKHCFHTHCIDEWLTKNSTCPVCRNSPSPAHNASSNV